MPVDRHVLANERTLMAWLRLAATLGLGSFLVGVLNKASTHAMPGPLALVQALVAILISCVATVRFYQRDVLLKQRHMGDAFGDWLLPSVAGVTILLIVSFNVSGILGRWYEWQFRAHACVALPGLPQVLRAPQPHVYISMHGSNNPADNICHPERGVSGIHKFSVVTGEYIGPSTDQLQALVRMPRAMLLVNDRLLVADGSSSGRGIAVFAPCEPPLPDGIAVSPRAFLGYIRPPQASRGGSAAQAEASAALLVPSINDFQHPYGLALDSSGRSIRLSTQNGGAVISVDLVNGSIAKRHQVAAFVPPSQSTGGGHVRGIAVDGSGCEHVADRDGHRLVSFCPPNAPTPTGITKVHSPIAVYYSAHTNQLFVSSLGVGLSKRLGGDDSAQSPPTPTDPQQVTSDSAQPTAVGTAAIYAFDLPPPLLPGTAAASTPAASTPDPGAPFPPLTLSRVFADEELSHPSGLFVHDGTLFVLDQLARALLAFDVSSGAYLGPRISGLPDRPEDVIMVPKEC